MCIYIYISPRWHNKNLSRTGPKAHKPQPVASIYTFKDRFKRCEHSRCITAGGKRWRAVSPRRHRYLQLNWGDICEIKSQRGSFSNCLKQTERPPPPRVWGLHGNKQASLSGVFAELMVNTLGLFFHVLVDWVSQWAGMTKESILILTLRGYGWRREEKGANHRAAHGTSRLYQDTMILREFWPHSKKKKKRRKCHFR